jgi:hypothetical protein
MRSCPRSEELRDAVSAEEELSPTLAAHVATCSECAAAWAAARRFESGLDAAVSELVTDALPPTTVAASRSTPRASGRPPWAGMAFGALVTAALAAFAAIGVLTVAGSLSDSVGSRLGGGPTASEEATTTTVDCQLGDATVEVTVETTDPRAPSRIAYCVGGWRDDERVGDARVITCALLAGSDAPPGREDARRGAYLDACARVERVVVESPSPVFEDVVPAPSKPFRTWDEAADAVPWRLAAPTWLPDGYELAALQGFGGRTEPDVIGSVVASYLRNGTLLSVEQFYVQEPDAFRVELTIPGDALGDIETGQTAVGDSPAFWAQGVVEFTSGGPNLNVETLVLTWSDGEVGYRITSRSDDLATLRRIAESLGGG